MQKINIILIILLSWLSIPTYTQKNEFRTPDNSNSSQNLLVQQSLLCLKKHALLVALIPICNYYRKDIYSFIQNKPYSSSLLFYICLHYICDSILQYQKQKKLLDLIHILKKLTLYLVMSYGVKNYIEQKKIIIDQTFNEQLFFNTLTKQVPYSFDEITSITIKSYQKLKSSLQKMNETLHVESEEFIFLCHASSITIDSLLYLAQNDPELYKKIAQFEQEPQKYMLPLTEYLSSIITSNFIELNQKMLLANIQEHATS